jgi:heat shock protein HtpX
MPGDGAEIGRREALLRVTRELCKAMFRTGLLIAALTAFFMALGYWIGGGQGMLAALVAAGAVNFIAYWSADKAVLALYGAREASEVEEPELFRIVRDLARRAELPAPRIYVIESKQPNAFATGRDPEHATVAVTQGLLRTLTRQEITGVLAHELAHVKHRDTLTMTITATLAGAIGMVANFLILFAAGRNGARAHPVGVVVGLLIMFLAPLAATLVQLAVSRTREYAADAAAAEITGQPFWLADALARIAERARYIANEDAERNPATAHLFIVNPLRGDYLGSLFATHPRVEARIARLTAFSKAASPWAASHRRPY